MVLAYFPQKFRGAIIANTNYVPQISNESGGGGIPTFNDVTYVNGGQRGSTSFVIGGQRGKVDYMESV